MIKNITNKSTIVKKLEWADTIGKQTLGLMFRKELGKDSGFLMKFSRDGKHGIWMPFMKFPIDIVYINKNKKIVDIKHSVPAMSKNPFTWRIYKPKEKSRYVLEVNAGHMKRTKSSVGDLLEF